ncbi:MAG: DNA photolyase [bacterium]|nr:DNA photolyase [bacterium]
MARVYLESEVAAHSRSLAILDRLPKTERVECARYTEVFNRRAQNFRLQKLRPALILARKHRGLVLPAPPGYGVGGEHNFYFSHMLNCVYDCRYCFLQGMYRSANYVLFVNYEDFFAAIDSRLAETESDAVWFFSGYDCDSLALEGLTGFASGFLPFFAARPQAWLELRTKSTQTRSLLETEAIANCVVAFSFTPEAAHRKLEAGVPSIENRLAAMRKLAERGWRLGVRFDPLLWSERFEEEYRRLVDRVFSVVPVASLHSVSFGPFRLPADFFRRMAKLMPDERLFAGALETVGGVVSYRSGLERELAEFVNAELARRVPAQVLFPCAPEGGVAAAQRGEARSP